MAVKTTNPLFGRLNLFYSQLKVKGDQVAKMRANGTAHEKIDLELTYMGQLNIKLAEICSKNNLNMNTLLDKGVEAVVPRHSTTH